MTTPVKTAVSPAPPTDTKTAVEVIGEKDVVPKYPDLEIAQLRYLVTHTVLDSSLKKQKWELLLQVLLSSRLSKGEMKAIKENEMAPLYEMVCEETGEPVDQALLVSLRIQNQARLAEMDGELKDAEENLGEVGRTRRTVSGESEVRQAWLRKSNYLCQIGAKTEAEFALRQTYAKTVGVGYRADLILQLIRLGFFFMDLHLVASNIAKVKDLMEQGADWDRKNRLRAYEGLYRMAIRDMKGAAELFLEAVPTFSSPELFSYETLIFYTCVTAIYCILSSSLQFLALERPDLRKRVMRSNEIQEQLTGGGVTGGLIPTREYVEAFFECRYERFFLQLAAMEAERLKFDRYLQPHYDFYTRGMRLRAYQQFLTPYKTVRLDMMARDFGVSKAFLDSELHKFIATGQLNCRIDAVAGVVETNHLGSKNRLYKTLIRESDTLLNRVQKLAQVINP